MAGFDSYTIVDILEQQGDGGRMRGAEVKCWSPYLSTYAAGTRGGHESNGHVFGFGNTREAALRKVIGAPESGNESDGTFNHKTGIGHVRGTDWQCKPPPAKPRPDYREALQAGRKLDVIVHEIHGGFDAGAVKVLNRLSEQAKADRRDGTDYSTSNTRSFRTHWTRRIGAAIMVARGAHLVRQMTLFSRGTFVTRDRRVAGAIRRAVRDGGEHRGRKRVRDEGAARPPSLMLSDFVVPQISSLLS